MLARINALLPARRRAGRRSRRGMTLVEVMVVIAIVLTLSSILAYGVWRIFAGSKVETTKLQMTKVSEQVEIYILKKKKAPGTSDGLAAVFGDEESPKDSWGNDFVYVSPGPGGKPFDLMSFGADGAEGGTGNDEDIKLSDVR